MRLVATFALLVLAGACSFDPGGLAETGASTDAGQQASDAASTSDAGADADAAVEEDGFAPIRLNFGGPEHTGTEFPGRWLAEPSPGGACGIVTGLYTTTDPINGTDDDALFTAEVFDDPVSCAIGDGALPAGTYHVTMLFAEIFYGAGCPVAGGVGSRVFDVLLEGDLVADDLDVFALAGCARGAGTPLVRSFDVQIDDGTLDVSMPASATFATLSAISITRP